MFRRVQCYRQNLYCQFFYEFSKKTLDNQRGEPDRKECPESYKDKIEKQDRRKPNAGKIRFQNW